MVVEQSGGQEGYVKGSKEKGGGIGIKVTLLKLKRIIRNRLKIVLKLKSVCGKKRQVKHGKGGGRKERVNKREEKRVEKKRKFISSILFVFEVSVLVMLSIKTLMYLHGKKSKRIWLLANSFYLLYTANYLSNYLSYLSSCESIFKSNKNEE